MMTRSSQRSVPLVLSLVGAAAFAAPYDIAAAQDRAKPPIFADFRSKLALDGHDAVAYFTTGKPVRGVAAHAVTWNGATWHFASPDNKAAFKAKPEAFLPQYGGYCAWAVSQGYTAKGDPNHWRIVDGKLYLNYNASVQKSWERDIPGHVSKADKNWPTVLSK